MEWLECVEQRSTIAGEDVRFSLSQVDWDFNCDDVITISDIWEGLKWLVHVLGDLLVSWVSSPRMLQFLEIGDTPYGTHFSTLIGWPILITIIIYAFIFMVNFFEGVIYWSREVFEAIGELMEFIGNLFRNK